MGIITTVLSKVVMNILHYSLGLAPQRSGGLPKYATDLMMEQSKRHRVSLLYPSGYRPFRRRIVFHKGKKHHQIQTFSLRNTFPIPLLFGIKSPTDFLSKRSFRSKDMEALFESIQPDVFHVHTLMGLPIELLEFFSSKGVKQVYSSHDYFGICPKVNFIDHREQVCSTPSQETCSACNESSSSTLFLRLRNSSIALQAKNNPFLRRWFK